MPYLAPYPVEPAGNRCSKSGIISCTLKDKCMNGKYFHVKCVEEHDPTFNFDKKSRGKWYCKTCL